MSTVPVTPIPARRDTACPFAPPPAYTEAAGTGPVSRAELPDGSPCWLVTGYQEVRTVLSDRRFSADVRRPAFPFLVEGRRELIAANPSFLRLDDPEHARLRRMVTGEFLVKRVEAMRPGIQRIVDEALDRMTAGGGPADLVADFALPVPSLVICLLLGVPYEDREAFQANSRLLLATEAAGEDFARAQKEMLDYLAGLAERKRSEPGEDILSRLAARGEHTQRGVAAHRGGGGVGGAPTTPTQDSR
ncbi:cytochrome P450, partial [Kitasatospora sp. NPDC059463]